MSKEKVIFLIATEYHLIMSYSIISQFYYHNTYEFLFLNLRQSGKKRVNIDTNTNKHTFTEYCYDLENLADPINKKAVSILNDVKLVEGVKSFISFLYHDIFFIYLSKHFGRKGVKVILVPDGMGAFVKIETLNARSRLLTTLNFARFLIQHSLNFRALELISWNFGRNGFYTNVWAPFKPIYVRKNAEYQNVSLELNPEYLGLATSQFAVPAISNNVKEGVLIIADRRDTQDELNTLVRKLTLVSKRPIFIKPHPNQQSISISGGARILCGTFPIELLIMQLNNWVIVSHYSNSQITENRTCLSIWTYKFDGINDKRKKVLKCNPTEFVRTPETEQIFFEAIKDFEKK